MPARKLSRTRRTRSRTSRARSRPRSRTSRARSRPRSRTSRARSRPRSRTSRARSRPRSRTRSRVVYYREYPSYSRPKYVYVYSASPRNSASPRKLASPLKAPTSGNGYKTNCEGKGMYSCLSSDKICKWNLSTNTCNRK